MELKKILGMIDLATHSNKGRGKRFLYLRAGPGTVGHCGQRVHAERIDIVTDAT